MTGEHKMTRKYIYLMAGVATAALLAGAPGAFAQTAVDQNTTNTGPVLNGTSATVRNTVSLPSITGDGASASISATGAVSSTSISSVNQVFNSSTTGSTTVNQGALNDTAGGTVRNYGELNVVGLKGDGSSGSISATGAVASVSISSIGSPLGSSASLGGITQGAANYLVKNNAAITNDGKINANTNGTDLNGVGSSLSISATGAASSVSLSSIDNVVAPSATIGGAIGQTTTNTGAIGNTGTILTGLLDGNGSSAGISATGALSSVSASSINDTAVFKPTFSGTGGNGYITQIANNSGGVTNIGTITSVGAGANLTGLGASASISALGAGSVVSFRTVK